MAVAPLVYSKENKEIKQLKNIIKHPRKNERFVVVEGLKHVLEFLRSPYYRLVKWFVDENKSFESFFDTDVGDISSSVIRVSSSLFKTFSDVVETQGVVGLFERMYSFEDYSLFNPDESTFILENLQDPGNMGTIIRTAVAFGRSQIILIGGVYPELGKVIRASAGLIAKIKIFRMNFTDITTYIFFQHKICFGTAADGRLISEFSRDQLGSAFIVLGNEGRGISQLWDRYAISYIALPMSKEVESLNVSVVGGILSYVMWGSDV